MSLFMSWLMGKQPAGHFTTSNPRSFTPPSSSQPERLAFSVCLMLFDIVSPKAKPWATNVPEGMIKLCQNKSLPSPVTCDGRKV